MLMEPHDCTYDLVAGEVGPGKNADVGRCVHLDDFCGVELMVFTVLWGASCGWSRFLHANGQKSQLPGGL